MISRKSVLFGLIATVVGCANSAITEPVVANTGTAKSLDGYEAAVAAAEAQGYPIVVKDAKHAFIRVRSRSSSGIDPATTVYLDVKAWSGCVDVRVAMPPGVTLADPQLRQLRSERNDLAWSISTRARLIAGEPLGPTVTDPMDKHALPLTNFPARSGPVP